MRPMKHLFSLLLLLPIVLYPQQQQTGIVKDAVSKKPIPFASIAFATGEKIFTDVTGTFTLPTTPSVHPVLVHYVGYKKQLLNPISAGTTIVYLEPLDKIMTLTMQARELGQKIMRTSVARANQNNPQKALANLEFKAYNKTTITAHPDSIAGRIERVFNPKKNKFSIDSSDFKFKKIIEKQHLFQTEKIAHYQWNKRHFKETILGSKMSGFKEPINELIGMQLQTFNLYDAHYKVIESKYTSPISKNGLVDYLFTLIDTATIENRPVFVVSFKNKKRINLKGLEGLVYLDAENFALAKAQIRVRGLLDINARHQYTFNPIHQLWLTTENEVIVGKGKNQDPIKLLGGTIVFEGEHKSNEIAPPKFASDFTYLHSKTRFFELDYPTAANIKNKAFAIEIQENAFNKETDYWNNYRTHHLSYRDESTYAAMDSIALLHGIEAKVIFGRKISNGFLPVGHFDFDLKHLLSYNHYEGFRFGIGGKTNDYFSKKARLEGYAAYGLKDETIKYQIGAATQLDRLSNSWIGASYTNDISEIGSTKFTIDKRIFKIYDPRPINVSTFYNHQTWKGFLETKIFPKTESIWQINRSVVTPLFDYTFNWKEKAYTRYTLTTASFSMLWQPYSSFMQTPKGPVEVEKRFPKFTFQWTQALPNVLNNDFTFTKLDLRAEYEKKFLNGQKTSVLSQFGYAFGAIPLTHLYNNQPNNLDKERLLQRVTFAGKNSFETMLFNEFFSSHYAMLHIKHGFKRIGILGNLKPIVVLVSRVAWGNMNNSEQHLGLNYKTLENGYFESGVELNHLMKGLGLAGFYRYGPNQLSRVEDNIALKLTFTINLGL